MTYAAGRIAGFLLLLYGMQVSNWSPPTGYLSRFPINSPVLSRLCAMVDRVGEVSCFTRKAQYESDNRENVLKHQQIP